jgi:hypothetical protein
VWTEFPVADNSDLLVEHHYFLLMKITENYFNYLEKNLNAHQYQVIISDNFNVHNYDSINGTPLFDSYYKKCKGSLIHVTTCFLGLSSAQLS